MTSGPERLAGDQVEPSAILGSDEIAAERAKESDSFLSALNLDERPDSKHWRNMSNRLRKRYQRQAMRNKRVSSGKEPTEDWMDPKDRLYEEDVNPNHILIDPEKLITFHQTSKLGPPGVPEGIRYLSTREASNARRGQLQ